MVGVQNSENPYVNDKESLLDVIEEASQYNSLIAYTLVIKELRNY